MKKSSNPFLFLENYCLRTPLFSLKTFFDLFYSNKANFEILKEFIENDIIQESIFLASPNLYDELKNLNLSNSPLSKKETKLLNSFFKYIIRLSTRCTPFGLFAGVSIGSFNQKTNIKIDEIQNHKRSSHLDSTVISQIINSLIKQENLNNKAHFIPNSTLYKIGNQYRYIEYTIQNNKREYSIEGIELNEYLEKILSNKKPKKINE